MSKIISGSLTLLIILAINISLLINLVFADEPVCGPGIGITYEPDPKQIPENQSGIIMKFGGLSNNWYRLRFAAGLPGSHVYSPEIQAVNGNAILFISNADDKLKYGAHNATLEKSDSRTGPWDTICKDVSYFVGYKPEQCRMALSPSDPTDLEQIRIDVANMPSDRYVITIESFTSNVGEIRIDNFGNGTATIGPFNPLSSNLYIISNNYGQSCKIPLVVKGSAGQSPRPLPTTSATPVPPSTTPMCDTNNPSYNPDNCSQGGGKPCGSDTDPAIATAIGCVHTSPVAFVKDLLKFVIAIGGGLAFLMMLLGAFQMVTSAGNPETLAAGKDRLTSAVIGLLFVIFAILLLRIIGVDILGLGQQFGL